MAESTDQKTKPEEAGVVSTAMPEIAPGKEALSLVRADRIAQYNTLIKVGNQLFRSGMFPNVQNEAGCFAVILLGHEHGIEPMTALNNINVIKGRPTFSSQLIQAKIMKAGISVRVVEASITKCTLEFSGLGDPYQETFDEGDAKRAGKIPAKADSVWANYPSEMLYWRCLSRGARRYCPDVILGMYLKEEVEEGIAMEEKVAPVKVSLNMKAGDESTHQEVGNTLDNGDGGESPEEVDTDTGEITEEPEKTEDESAGSLGDLQDDIRAWEKKRGLKPKQVQDHRIKFIGAVDFRDVPAEKQQWYLDMLQRDSDWD